MKQIRDAYQTPNSFEGRQHRDGANHPANYNADAARAEDAKAFLIEVDGEDAGLAVLERGGYRFVSANPRFATLDGSRFNRLGQLEAAAERLARRAPETRARFGA